MYTTPRLEWHLDDWNQLNPAGFCVVLQDSKHPFGWFQSFAVALAKSQDHRASCGVFAFGRSNAVRQWLDMGHPATRARHSRGGGRRIEPVGSDESLAISALSHLSLSKCDAMTWLRRGHEQCTERTVFTYGKAVLCSNIHQRGLKELFLRRRAWLGNVCVVD
jgi:hypothetical protein